MKFVLLFIVAIFSSNFLQAQYDSTAAKQEILSFQKELNESYKGKDSPLLPKDLKKFKSHSFYQINLAYRVVAKFSLSSESNFGPMKTTTSRLPNYRIYGMAQFTLHGQVYQLPVYQGQDLMTVAGYEDYLFLPFTDLTNGEETYDGGRYIGLRIPKGNDPFIIDFNQAYNPYCAYNEKYSCPIVPADNHLDIAIPAGVKFKKK